MLQFSNAMMIQSTAVTDQTTAKQVRLAAQLQHTCGKLHDRVAVLPDLLLLWCPRPARPSHDPTPVTGH
jgi:hypothetical protein